MDTTMLINALITVILLVLGFLLSRLWKSVDLLFQKCEDLKDDVNDKVDEDKAKEVASTISELELHRHREAMH